MNAETYKDKALVDYAEEVDRLEANIERVEEEYRKSANFNKSYSDANKLLHEEKEALESLNRDLVEALEFYAEEKNHDATELVCHSGNEPLHISLVYEDYGKRAKKVLEKEVEK